MRRFVVILKLIVMSAPGIFLVGCSIRGNSSEKFVHVGNNEVGACAHTSNSFNCVNVVKVYDADTIFVDIPGQHRFLVKELA